MHLLALLGVAHTSLATPAPPFPSINLTSTMPISPFDLPALLPVPSHPDLVKSIVKCVTRMNLISPDTTLGEVVQHFPGQGWVQGVWMSSLKEEHAILDYSELNEADRKVVDDWYWFSPDDFAPPGDDTKSNLRPKFASQSDQMTLHLCVPCSTKAARVWHGDCGDVSGRCELPPVPFQALLVDCSPDEPQHVAGAATPEIIVVHGLAPSSEGEAAWNAGMSFESKISWIVASDTGASRCQQIGSVEVDQSARARVFVQLHSSIERRHFARWSRRSMR
ncbi:hypothetical protein B0H19DRAFT_1284722 [Mycena capillaripes]|nr:hypothetical protein B0H19DRAFT_1284722 [Mycena capillaripes]